MCWRTHSYPLQDSEKRGSVTEIDTIDESNKKIMKAVENRDEVKKGRIFFQTKIGTVHDDFPTTNSAQEKSIGLIVTSPLYNVDVHYNSFSDDISYENILNSLKNG